MEGCQKGTNAPAGSGFIKDFKLSDYGSYAQYIEQAKDRNLLIIGSEDGHCFVLKTDLNGTILWHKPILNDSLSIDYIRSMHNGTYLCSDYNWFSMIDSSGNFLWQVSNTSIPFGTTGSDAVYSKGKYYQSFSNGHGTGSPSNSFVNVYDINHKYLSKYTYQDTGYYHGKTLWIHIMGANPNGTLQILGQKFCNTNWGWGDPTKVFFGNTSGTSLADTMSVDDQFNRYTDNPVNFITTSDSGFIIFGTRTDFSTNLASILIIVLDKKLSMKAQYTFTYNGFSTIPHNLSICKDGGYLVTGHFINTLSNLNTSGYILSIDKNVNKIWEKSFSPPGSTDFYSGIELNDGNIAVAGTTNGFGHNKNGSEVLVMKLGANGDLK